MKLNNPVWIFFLLMISFLPWHVLNASFFSNTSTHSIPAFNLPNLNSSQNFTQNDLKSCASLIVFWASWCGTCKQEHPVLMEIHNHYKISLYGIDYVDSRENASAFLAKKGNPYQMVGFDETGTVADHFGIKVVPESFLIDKKGRILYHHSGALDKKTWENVMLPKIKSCKADI